MKYGNLTFGGIDAKAEIEALKDSLDKGVITPEEFNKQKKKVIQSSLGWILFTNKQKKPAVKSAPANFGKMKKAMQKYKYGVEEIPDKDAPTEAVEAVEAAV